MIEIPFRARWLVLTGLLTVLLPTLLFSYLAWPMPGSQTLESLRFAWSLDRSIPVLWAVGALLTIFGLVVGIRKGPSHRVLFLATLALLLTAAILSWAHSISAQRVFLPFREVRFAHGVSEQLPPETLVLGLTAGNQAKAYPIRLLAYHHRLTDEIGGKPIWVTYCTMCRTGKIFDPLVDGQRLDFDLVGAFNYNSVYRDRQSGSWWYQANGRAVAGPHQGSTLRELNADQMTLGAWLELFPESEVLQPDPTATDGYQLFGFDRIDGTRPEPDVEAQWQWVVGIGATEQHPAIAYRWSRLSQERLIIDQIGELPIAVQLNSDGISFRVWNRRLGDQVLELQLSDDGESLIAPAFETSFGFDGVGVGGQLDGQSLRRVPAVLEFWHSFERFSGGQLKSDERL